MAPSETTPSAAADRDAWLRQPGRHRILVSAEKVFVRDGVHGARMDAIATEAGIARSHLYYHFKSKDELFAALVELRTADILASKAALLDESSARDDGHSGLDAEPLIRAAIEAVMMPYRDFLRLLVAETVRHPELPVPLRRILDSVLDDTVGRLQVAGHDVRARRAEIFYLLVVPAVMAVAMGECAIGDVRSPGDVAAMLAAEQSRLLADTARSVAEARAMSAE